MRGCDLSTITAHQLCCCFVLHFQNSFLYSFMFSLGGADIAAHAVTHLSMRCVKLLDQTVLKLSLKFNFVLRLCDAPSLEKVIFVS